MPTYQYICKHCGHQLEELQSMSEPPLVTCPSCSKDALARVMGSGAGVIFKGSGFYLTDYKNDSKKAGTKKEEKKTEASGTAKPAEVKPESKPSSPAPKKND